MEVIKHPTIEINELLLLRLSREIARDIHPLETILERFQIDLNTWETIARIPRFNALLQSETEAWNSASNTQERLKIKSLSFTEEALPERYARLHAPREPLSSKVELLKTVGRFGGVGAGQIEGSMGEKLTVTINLGADNQIKFEKDVTPIIDVTPDVGT